MVSIDPLLGAIGSAFLGFLATVAGGIALYKIRENQRKNILKSSLHAELSSIEDLYLFPDLLNAGRVPVEPMIQTRIYEANIDKIGLLDDPLRSAVIEFYSSLNMQRHLMTNEEFTEDDKVVEWIKAGKEQHQDLLKMLEE